MLRDPFDPDTEDRRPDREREFELEREESDRSPYGYDDDYEDDLFYEDEVSESSNQLRLFDDSDMVELSMDDLRDMEGPDA